VHYYNDDWIPINDRKENEMSDLALKLDALEEEHKNDEAIALVNDEMLTVVDKVLERLEAVDAKNKKVKKMNDMQIKAEEFLKDKSKDLITYYDGGDVSKQDINQYNEELKEKYDDVLDYRDKLMDQYNLEQTENEDEDSNFQKL